MAEDPASRYTAGARAQNSSFCLSVLPEVMKPWFLMGWVQISVSQILSWSPYRVHLELA